MLIQLIIIIYICILLVCSTHKHEHFIDTSQITESHVKHKITDINAFTLKVGYPFVCEKGQHYENDEKITERSEKIKSYTWKNAKQKIEKCFSQLVPVLEKSNCNLKHITKPS